jgi:CheY-like chemotaxis protein
VTPLSDGRQTLAWLQRDEPVDLLLLDDRLPDYTGPQLAAEIRRLPQGHHVPLILLTRSLDLPAESALPELGFLGCIRKPVRSVEFAETLVQVIFRQVPPANPGNEASSLPAADAGPFPVLDAKRFWDLAENDAQNAKDIVCLYVSQMQDCLNKLEAARQSGEAEEVRRLAHGCAGSSAACGFVAIVPPLLELEQAGSVGRLENALALMAQIRAELGRIQTMPHELVPN